MVSPIDREKLLGRRFAGFDLAEIQERHYKDAANDIPAGRKD
jgi:hypothetical protein